MIPATGKKEDSEASARFADQRPNCSWSRALPKTAPAVPPPAAPMAAPSSPRPDWWPMTPPAAAPRSAPVAAPRWVLGPTGAAQLDRARAAMEEVRDQDDCFHDIQFLLDG